MADRPGIPSLRAALVQAVPRVPVSVGLIVINVAVFLAMLASGSGFWHSSNGVPLAWGANFGPATQDGQWWRLASALFLHFGAPHLLMNMWALWDAGQLVERMYGHLRFTAIYFVSGVVGNLLSLVSHHGQVVSGGASGAIFGIYGALLVFLWRERRHLHPEEFRWLFWGASGFSAAIIVLGLLLPGIDNAAHVGGFLGGLLAGAALGRVLAANRVVPPRQRWLASAAFVLCLALLVSQIPAPAYRWSEEALARQEVSEFIRNDAAINQSWQKILNESRRDGASFEELAARIDTSIGDRYEESFEHLSQLPSNPALPSATAIEALRQYAELRRNASRALAEGLRSKDSEKIRAAIALDKKSREMPGPGLAAPGKARP